MTEKSPPSPQSHVTRPLLPAWAINLIITLAIVSLYPLSALLESQMDPYFLRIIVLIGINVLLATSLTLINGITGQFSLGHAGFMALGAYAVGTTMHRYDPSGIGGELALLGLLIVGGLVCAVVALFGC